MKIKKGFVLRKIGDEMIIVGEGLEQVNFNKIICINESATYLWNECYDKTFEVETFADLLFERYEVTQKQAQTDAKELIDKWMEAGLIE
jgi:hypothetical protein